MGIGVAFAIVINLAILGFGIDFSNAFTKNSSSMYVLLLPLGFIVGVVYFFIMIKRRREQQQRIRYVTNARSEFAKNYNLGNNIPTMIIRTLEKKGAMNTAEIAHRLSMDEPIIKEHVRTMLLAQQVRQQIKDGTAFYSVNHWGER